MPRKKRKAPTRKKQKSFFQKNPHTRWLIPVLLFSFAAILLYANSKATSKNSTRNNEKVSTYAEEQSFNTPQDWKTFVSEEHNIKFSYPPTWNTIPPRNPDRVGNIVHLRPAEKEEYTSKWDGHQLTSQVEITISAREIIECKSTQDSYDDSEFSIQKTRIGDGIPHVIEAKMRNRCFNYSITLNDDDYSKEELHKQIVSTFKFTN